jgi:hypothetical protein
LLSTAIALSLMLEVILICCFCFCCWLLFWHCWRSWRCWSLCCCYHLYTVAIISTYGVISLGVVPTYCKFKHFRLLRYSQISAAVGLTKYPKGDSRIWEPIGLSDIEWRPQAIKLSGKKAVTGPALPYIIETHKRKKKNIYGFRHIGFCDMSSLLLFNRVYRLQIKSVMLVFRPAF